MRSGELSEYRDILGIVKRGGIAGIPGNGTGPACGAAAGVLGAAGGRSAPAG